MGRGGEAESADLEEVFEELQKQVEHTQRENLLFEAYLERVNPQLARDEELEPKKKTSVKGGKRKETPKTRTLTADEKNDIAGAEIEVLQAAVEQLKQEGEGQLGELRARLEETDLRIAEIKKDTYEFKRDIVVGAENFRSGKTVAEKMLRYMEQTALGKDSMIEKLRLKNATLKAQIQKLEQQLQQKEEMGEVLHAIDFDQLKIENQQFLEKIEERNNELLRLKLTTGKTVQVLNQLKKRLGQLTQEGAWLRRETAERTEQVAKFELDIARVEEEKLAAEKTNKALRAEQDDSDKPQVLEYIKLKAEVAELERKAADWERKLELAQLHQ
mmetsp:Transcript_24892/g.81496  ORF Transcript_24892/g.81496 Transcript_24892/m.81496 type:complete len:330 (-) Transcript_24892:1166-2155(-)|eukprot:CAMPEP_0170141586 /NCGR_PEP_ID=MMETSP0033_2-20121228/7096_1 /TAXON_ID=195969 /ORGANISM="Dolichomastix tenuilepis, Strain CCMP3274" /LENGTH=329 /DNA_ID=CAMNT_0010377869 /DNA_START=46 /DNA_END=1035 /DNA_ORIENTATION=+